VRVGFKLGPKCRGRDIISEQHRLWIEITATRYEEDSFATLWQET
jgi:hypothetical protein